MSEGEGKLKYILILKDDFSNYVWLVNTRTCDTDGVVEALREWISCFGAPKIWISDQGSHFKNEVMAKLAAVLKTKHHFTSAYHAQSNGTVEVVCRETLRACRALISEYKLGPAAWPQFTKVIQTVLNNSASDKLGGKIAPITAFAALPSMEPMGEIL